MQRLLTFSRVLLHRSLWQPLRTSPPAACPPWLLIHTCLHEVSSNPHLLSLSAPLFAANAWCLTLSLTSRSCWNILHQGADFLLLLALHSPFSTPAVSAFFFRHHFSQTVVRDFLLQLHSHLLQIHPVRHRSCDSCSLHEFLMLPSISFQRVDQRFYVIACMICSSLTLSFSSVSVDFKPSSFHYSAAKPGISTKTPSISALKYDVWAMLGAAQLDFRV